jgi:hypothetical protein
MRLAVRCFRRIIRQWRNEPSRRDANDNEVTSFALKDKLFRKVRAVDESLQPMNWL